MPVDWTELKENISKATEATHEWSDSAYQQGSDWIKNSGVQDVTLGDLWNVPFNFANQLSIDPSAAKYRDCKDKNGQSGWDERGLWRCLFPNAKRPPVWYSNYSDFLEARDVKYRESQKELDKWTNPRFVSPEEAQGKKATGRTVNVETKTDENGNAVTKRQVTTFYEDGTATKEEDSKGGWFWN